MQNSTRLSASELAARLAERAPALCSELLPAGRRHGAEWRVGSVGGEVGQSLGVRLSGSKKGVWRDFATGEGGDALGLVKAVLGFGTREALAWSTQWLGLDGAGGGGVRHHRGGAGGRVGADHQHQDGVGSGGDGGGGRHHQGGGGDVADHDRNTTLALAIWRESQPAAGTLVHVYLEHRGITTPPPASLRYHPALRHGPTGLALPAMVAGVQAPDRRVLGIQRTFLRADGRGKAPVSDPKMSLGSVPGGAVRLAKAGPVTGLAEGVETGLSAMQRYRLPVWAALGSALDRVELPQVVETIIVFADSGEAGERAAERATAKFSDQGRRVCVRFPDVGDDFNDELRARQGIAA